MPKELKLKYVEYQEILIKYLNLDEFSNLSPLKICHKKVDIISLLNFLGDCDVRSLNQLKPYFISEYLISISHLATSTIAGRRFIYRHFFNYLYQEDLISFSGSELFPVIISNKREKVPSFYSQDEICRLIAIVDNKTLYGKRDLCILLLIAELGIRSGDIIRLKLSDIHWERDTIEFLQYKTKVFLQLPLFEEIKYALLDYLKNARPNTESEYVFIGIRNNYKPISNTQVHQTVSKYFEKASIDVSSRHHGPHAMRYSLASNLLNSNTPIHVIKEVLGHTNLNTTKIYLNINLFELRKFALEVPYETL